PRKISLWNGFVSREMKKYNEERGRGDRDRVSSSFIKELSRRWKQMSKEEQEEAGAEAVQELGERRENREEGIHNVPLHAYNDIQATLSSIRRQIENLNGRTGAEFLVIGVRSNPSQMNPPYVFYTSERLKQFVELINNTSLSDFTLRLEGYCVAGVDSLKKSTDSLIDLKHRVAAIVLEKLQAACTRANITKMFYVNFHEHITMRYGVVLERWPLPKFVAPGKLSSRQELNILLSAFENDVAFFRQLTNPEWEEW
ncbi:hypothetical protein C2E23DRAFT_692686, partial [Lenzites betulinus]